MMKRDPIVAVGERLLEQERFAQAELDAVDKEVLAEVEEAGRSSPRRAPIRRRSRSTRTCTCARPTST